MAIMEIAETSALRKLPARERILLTAHALFYRDGIRATGIDRVIAEAEVTKTTFYRHFPSKNDLIRAFLDYRHERWMTWFRDALARHGRAHKGIAALLPTLAEWFERGDFRGCAFINSVSELGGDLSGVRDTALSHKQDMLEAIEGLLETSKRRSADAYVVALAVDGAIVHAQFGEDIGTILRGLARLIRALE